MQHIAQVSIAVWAVIVIPGSFPCPESSTPGPSVLRTKHCQIGFHPRFIVGPYMVLYVFKIHSSHCLHTQLKVTFNQGIFNNVEKHLGLSQLRGCCWHLLFRDWSLWVWGCTHSSNTWVEAGEMNQWGHFWLHSELNISLSYTRLSHTSLHRGQRFPFTPNRHHHHPCHGHHYKELSSSVHCMEAKKHRCEALAVSLHPAAVIAIHNLLNVDLWLILDLGCFFQFFKMNSIFNPTPLFLWPLIQRRFWLSPSFICPLQEQYSKSRNKPVGEQVEEAGSQK